MSRAVIVSSIAYFTVGLSNFFNYLIKLIKDDAGFDGCYDVCDHLLCPC
jgi:hypothetical protein